MQAKKVNGMIHQYDASLSKIKFGNKYFQNSTQNLKLIVKELLGKLSIS